MPTVAPRVLAAVPSAILGLLVALVLVFVVPWWLAIVVGVLATIVLVFVLERRAPAAALRALGATPLDEGAEPRLESIVESICATSGSAEPSLHVADSRVPDVAVLGRVDDTHLVVSTGALRQLDRLELEAVVARQLATPTTELEAATTLVPVSTLLGPLAPRVRARVLDDRRMAGADLEGVKITRYPPALASALEKAAAAGTTSGSPAASHLWLIGPAGGADPEHPPLHERIDTLREL